MTVRPQEMECRWLRGTDRQAFESFFSHLVRKVAALAPSNPKQGHAMQSE